MKKLAFALGALLLAGAAHAENGWYCPAGWEEWDGQCWKAADPVTNNVSKSQASSTSSASANSAVTVNNRGRQSAASAIAPQLNGYSFPNCFGDVNPSGSFTAGVQTFGWGVAAGSSKASNVCAVYAIAGPAAAMAYLQKMDRNVPRGVTVPQQMPLNSYRCPDGSAWDGKGCWKGRR